MELTQEYLKEALHYDPETGIFTWREDRPLSHFKDWRGYNGYIGNIRNSLVAGYKPKGTDRNPRNYLVIGLNSKLYRAHRLAWLYVYGYMPEEAIDHINQDTLDNRISNLRLDIDKINHRNRTRYKNNSSGLCGVSFHKKLSKWQAEGQQTLNDERIRHYLGVHTTLFEAACARKSWEIKFGYTENHGRVK